MEPGRVLAGEYPGEREDSWRSRATVDLLVDAGVRTFIDLTEPGELTPYDHHVAAAADARRLDLRYRRFPIPDFSVLVDDADDEILDAIRAEAERGAVYVHCWGGVGRTGTVVGCLLADDGHHHDTIAARLVELRDGTRKADRHCPETDAQRQVIRARVERFSP